MRAAGHVEALRRAGIREGDRVGIVTHGTLDTIAAIVGQVAAGIVTVPINPRTGPSELDHIVRDAAPKAICVDPGGPGSEVASHGLARPIAITPGRDLP